MTLPGRTFRMFETWPILFLLTWYYTSCVSYVRLKLKSKSLNKNLLLQLERMTLFKQQNVNVRKRSSNKRGYKKKPLL